MKKKKDSRWRREQEQRKKSLTFKIIKWFLILIAFIFLVGIGWRAIGFFKNSVWDGRSRLNLALKISPISLVSFDARSQTINFLIIPDGTYIEAAGDYGPYRIEKIYPLGELEGRGMALLTASLEGYLGLPIDGWLMADEKWEEAGGARRLLSDLIGTMMKDKLMTNLSYWDLARLWLMTSRTRAHKIEAVNLGETTVAEEFSLPDGTQSRRINSQRINQIISRLFTDDRLRQEDLAIAIMNAGGKTGLAAKGARLVTNIGGRLVEVGDWPEPLDSCQIKTTPDNKKTYTSQKLAKVFGCQIETDLGKEARWDLLIILTSDSW